MFLTNPAALYLLLLLVPVIILYILKIRLRREPVSTFIFWQQVFDERRTRSFWQHFRYLLSLLLTLLFLLTLIGAVLDPVLKSQAQQGRCIIIIDNSASMNALTDSGKTRLETAKDEVLTLLKSSANLRSTAILTAGGSPQIISGFTNHNGTLHRCIESISPSNQVTSLKETIHLAQRLTASEDNTPILVYTDGCVPQNDFNAVSGRMVHYVPVGKPDDNLAITQFQPRWSLNDAAGYEILTETVFFGTETVQARLEIEWETEGKRQLIEVLPLTLEPGKPQTKIVQGTSIKGGTFIASLKYAVSEKTDPLLSDNTVTVSLPPKKTLSIDYYGKENYFLLNALRSQPNVELTVLTSETQNPQTEKNENRVSVFYQTVPAAIPQGNVLVFDPQNGCDLFDTGKPLEAPVIAEEKSDSPLMNFVRLTNVLVPGARQLIPRSGSPLTDGKPRFPFPVVLAKTADNSPVYLQWKSAQRNTVVLTGNLNQSDLPLRTAFPIMIAQVLNQFNRNSSEIEKFLTPGLEESNLRLAPQSFYQQPALKDDDFYVQNRPIWFYLICFAMFLTTAEWFLFNRRWID